MRSISACRRDTTSAADSFLVCSAAWNSRSCRAARSAVHGVAEATLDRAPPGSGATSSAAEHRVEHVGSGALGPWRGGSGRASTTPAWPAAGMSTMATVGPPGAASAAPAAAVRRDAAGRRPASEVRLRQRDAALGADVAGEDQHGAVGTEGRAVQRHEIGLADARQRRRRAARGWPQAPLP
jgi:hypothetical protein